MPYIQNSKLTYLRSSFPLAIFKCFLFFPTLTFLYLSRLHVPACPNFSCAQRTFLQLLSQSHVSTPPLRNLTRCTAMHARHKDLRAPSISARLHQSQTCNSQTSYLFNSRCTVMHARYKDLRAPSISARLQLAALYAATSTLLPEPHSRMTGGAHVRDPLYLSPTAGLHQEVKLFHT